MKNWSVALNFSLVPGFTFWVCFLSSLFAWLSLNFVISQWHPVFSNLKIARKLIGFNLLADLIIFLVLGYISVDFVFVFIGFMLFSRFCKFAVNISICDNNWFVCSLKVFCVLIISSFSVGQLSTLVLYLAQG